MTSRYEVELTLSSANDLKNINWQNGPIRPYVAAWVDSDRKFFSRTDVDGDTCPSWNETLVIPLNARIDDSVLYIDLVHAKSDHDDIKPLIGSARIQLRDIADEVGIGSGAKVARSLQLRRRSGRPHGKVEVKIGLRDPHYHVPEPTYGVGDRGYDAYANYQAPPPTQQYGGPPPAGYGYPYGGPPVPQPAYGGEPMYQQGGGGGYGYDCKPAEEKKSKFGGMGTGLAVGAVAGVLGGLALAEGFDALEDHLVDEAAEQVKEDLEDEEDAE